jgi:hypothetical protein
MLWYVILEVWIADLLSCCKIQPDGSRVIGVADKAANGEVWIIKDVLGNT